MDRYTRWPEAIPLSSITAEAVVQTFISGWIARFGVPSSIVTDRGRQFQSGLWNNLTALLGTKRSRTTSYHPQANGMVERFHRQLKAALKAQPDPDSWMTTPLILLGIRMALKQDLNSTAAEMVYGTTLHIPGGFFNPLPPSSLAGPSDFLTKLKNHYKHIQPTPRDNTKTASIPQNLSTATHVFVRHDAVRKPLQLPYNGPYPIIKCTAKYFTIKLNNRTENISIDRLKPAHLDPTNTLLDQCTPAPSQQLSLASPTPQLRPSTQPSATPTTTNTHTTHSGRRVHFPKYLSRHV